MSETPSQTRADLLSARLGEEREELERAIHSLVVDGSYTARRAALKGEILLARMRDLETAMVEFGKSIIAHHATWQ